MLGHNAAAVSDLELSTALRAVEFNLNQQALSTAQSLAQKYLNENPTPSESAKRDLGQLRLIQNFHVLNPKMEGCVGEDKFAQMVGAGVMASAVVAAQKPCTGMFVPPAENLEKAAEQIQAAAGGSSEKTFVADVRTASLRLATHSLLDLISRFSSKKEALDQVRKLCDKEPCKQQIEEFARAKQGDTLSIQAATDQLNQTFEELNKHIAKIEAPKVFGSRSLDSYIAQETLEYEWTQLLQRPEGRLLVSRKLMDMAQNNDGPPAGRPHPFNKVRPLEVANALKDVARANRDFIASIDRMELKQMIRHTPVAVAEVLVQHPENFELVCAAIKQIAEEDRHQERINGYVDSAAHYLEIGSWASLALPVGGWATGLTAKLGGGASIHAARLALVSRMMVNGGMRGGQIGMAGMMGVAGINNYQAYQAYSAYREGMSSFVSGTGTDQTAVKARADWDKARHNVSESINSALKAGVLIGADKMILSGVKYGGPLIGDYAVKFYRSAGDNTKKLLQRNDVQQAAEKLSSQNPGVLENVVGAASSLAPAKQIAVMGALTALASDQPKFTAAMNRASADLNSECAKSKGANGVCPNTTVTQILENAFRP